MNALSNPQTREAIIVGALALPAWAALNFANAANDLVSNPTSSDAQTSAKNARALFLAAVAASGVALGYVGYKIKR